MSNTVDRLLKASETLGQYVSDRNNSDQPFNEFETAYVLGLVAVLATAVVKLKGRRLWKFTLPASRRNIQEAEYLMGAFNFIDAVNIKPWNARATESAAGVEGDSAA